MYKPSNPRLGDYLWAKAICFHRASKGFGGLQGQANGDHLRCLGATKNLHMHIVTLMSLFFLRKEELFIYFTFLGILISESGIKNGSALIALFWGFFLLVLHSYNIFFPNWFNLDCQPLLRDSQKQKYSLSDLRKKGHRGFMKSNLKYLFRLPWELT